MIEPLHVERQNFSTVFYAMLLAMGVLGLFIALPGVGEDASADRVLVGFALVSVSAILLNVLAMTIRVMPDEITIHFGRTFYFYSKHIGLDDIRAVEVTEFQPIRESGGWGIRWGKHNGEKAHYFSARGNRAVLLRTHQGLMIVGSPDPERLADAIRRAKQDAQSAGVG